MPTANDARKELSKFARGDANWRLASLYLAHPEVPSGYSESEVAKAWPTHESDYRMLGVDSRGGVSAPDKQYSVTEESSEFRQLSEVTNKSDWDSGPFGEKIIHSDRAIKRALAFEDSIANLDVLFRQEIQETVIEGARQSQIARDAASVINVDRSKGDHPRGPDDAFAPSVAEGAAIPDDAGENQVVSWDTEKHGQGARATEELLNQALVDVIARNIEHLGRACENAINRIWLTELVDNAGETVDTSLEDNRGIAAINEAIHRVELNNYQPDTVAQHPTMTKTLFDTAENNALIPFANQSGNTEGLRDRVAFPLLGLEGFRGSGDTYDPDGANTWDYTAAGETGGIVYDRGVCNLYMFRDVEVKEYDDPVRDLEGVNARVEADCVLGQPDAAAKLTHS